MQNIKAKVISIIVLAIISLATIVLLDRLAVAKINKQNAFQRSNRFSVTLLREADLNGPIRTIAGLSRDTIFLCTNNPAQLIAIDTNLRKTASIFLPLKNAETLALAFSTVIDSSGMDIMACGLAAIYRRNTGTLNADTFKVKSNFTRAVRISPTTFIIRAFDSTAHDQILRKENICTRVLLDRYDVFDRFNDGGMTTDGYLLFDPLTSSVLYVHFYVNRILCLDTNLNLRYRSKTIDTFSEFQVSASGIRVNSKKTNFSFSSPPRRINYFSTVNNGRLYINSALKADNESDAASSKNWVIDVYEVKKGNYLGSFYIPRYGKGRIKDFKILDNRLIVACNNWIGIFRIEPAGNPKELLVSKN